MKKKKAAASIYTALRIPNDLRNKAEAKAELEGRTLSNYIKHLIRMDLHPSTRRCSKHK
jgi:predicted DNA-binding protein